MRVALRITCTLHACMFVAPEAHNEVWAAVTNGTHHPTKLLSWLSKSRFERYTIHEEHVSHTFHMRVTRVLHACRTSVARVFKLPLVGTVQIYGLKDMKDVFPQPYCVHCIYMYFFNEFSISRFATGVGTKWDKEFSYQARWAQRLTTIILP